MPSTQRQLVTCLIPALLLLACGQAEPDYYPLEPGIWWQYDIRLLTMDGPRQEKQVVRNLARAEEPDGVVYYRQTANGQQSRYRVTAAGIQRSPVVDNKVSPSSTALVLGLPLQPGTQWTGSIISSVLEKTGPPQDTLFRVRETVEMTYRIVSVTDTLRINGRVYENCVRVEGHGTVNANVGNYIGRISITVETDDWYAAGIGLLKSVHRESTDSETISAGEYRLVLEHFSPG